jgi:hypothetical protein
MYETLGALRIDEMFDIVVDYPDSLPAIRDTAECLRHTNLHKTFVARFRRAVQQRLLHAGAATTGIIHQYVSTIRALRGVDPSGGRPGCGGRLLRGHAAVQEPARLTAHPSPICFAHPHLPARLTPPPQARCWQPWRRPSARTCASAATPSAASSAC